MSDPGWYMAPLVLWLGACSGDTLSLGDETMAAAPAASRCAASTAVEGTVIVQHQADLEALAGCEVIAGNLEIAQFAGADLRPLASLRSVEGDLYIGQTPSLSSGWVSLEGGWLDSLEGLESLERTGALVLENVNAPSLLPLGSLRNVNANAVGSWRAGNLVIDRAHHLVDLSGLEQLGGVTHLVIVDNAALESLDGLALPFRVEAINLSNDPRLADIDALAHVRSVDSLQLHNTAVHDLAALSELGVGEAISIADNRELVDVSALQVWVVKQFDVERNPRLDGTLVVPEPSSVYVGNNAELDRIELSQVAVTGDNWAGNALLTHIGVGYDASLSSIDLGGLEKCGSLDITGNDNLSQIAMPALEGAVSLVVVNNPRLSTAAFDELDTLERRIEKNAD